ncbi:MAG: tetratricopeptide repeat protein, partial [Gemmatimonadales bacterium]
MNVEVDRDSCIAHFRIQHSEFDIRHSQFPRSENLAAYDPYLRGLDHYERGQIGQNWESLLLAVELFDSAATLDPSFAMAHIMLANAHLLLGGSGYDETLQPQMFGAPRMALVKAALDDAEELDPDLAEFHAAMRHYYGRLGESERAEEHLVAVLRRKPNDPDALLSLAGFQIQRGELDSAEASLEKAGELDPRSAATAGSIRSRYATLGRYEDALPYAERAISLAATEPAPYTAKAWLHILAGDT